MERAAVQPTDDQRPFVEAAIDIADRQPARARSDCQARASQVLRLDGEESVRDGDRVGGPLLAEQLACESRFDEDCRGAEAYAGTPAAMNSRP